MTIKNALQTKWRESETDKEETERVAEEPGISRMDWEFSMPPMALWPASGLCPCVSAGMSTLIAPKV